MTDKTQPPPGYIIHIIPPIYEGTDYAYQWGQCDVRGWAPCTVIALGLGNPSHDYVVADAWRHYEENKL